MTCGQVELILSLTSRQFIFKRCIQFTHMGLSKLWRHVWSALWLSPTMAPPRYFVTFALVSLLFWTFYLWFGLNSVRPSTFIHISYYSLLRRYDKHNDFWSRSNTSTPILHFLIKRPRVKIRGRAIRMASNWGGLIGRGSSSDHPKI